MKAEEALLEKEEKFMETFDATIIRNEKTTILALHVHEKRLDIVLTEDNPNNVKNVFNNLLKQLKKGEFHFILNDNSEDLFFHISNEYIKHLNSEISAVFKELEDLNLLEVKGDAVKTKAKAKAKK